MTRYKFFSIFFFVFLVCGLPIIAKATWYECNTGQALMWKGGSTLVPDKTSFSRKDEILKFDDETGTLWTAYDKDAPFAQVHLDVIEKMNSIGELTALSTGLGKDGVFEGTDIFRIRTDKKNGLVFLHYYAFGENEVTTGKCHIGKPYPY